MCSDLHESCQKVAEGTERRQKKMITDAFNRFVSVGAGTNDHSKGESGGQRTPPFATSLRMAFASNAGRFVHR